MTRTTKRAERRAPLSRERVLDAAIKLADRGGLESLTMRRLGQELGVEGMALYYHFANKDEVIDGMVDLVFSEIDLPAAGADWKTAMRRRAQSLRETLLRHR
jgi:AcrR family transcriptional regulator